MQQLQCGTEITCGFITKYRNAKTQHCEEAEMLVNEMCSAGRGIAKTQKIKNTEECKTQKCNNDEEMLTSTTAPKCQPAEARKSENGEVQKSIIAEARRRRNVEVQKCRHAETRSDEMQNYRNARIRKC